jgi:tetratricopeptide (TPR) repeat protein
VLQLDPELHEMPASRAMLANHLATDLIECGRIEDAGRYLTRYLSNAPDANLVNLLGQTYFLRGEMEEAERCYRQAAELDPGHYAPHLGLAKVAVQLRRREDALKHLNQARLLAPREYSVLYNLASVYRQLGLAAEANDVQDAIRDLRTSITSAQRIAKGAWPRYAL